MLKLFNSWRSTGTVSAETQRARFERLVSELNEAIADLPERPDVTISGASGQITIEAPAQFADEALALPKPAPEDKTPETTSKEGESSGAKKAA